MMTAPVQDLTHDVVCHLIDVCRVGERRFELASKASTDPMLRAEFAQYSIQRREFIGELVEAVHLVGDDDITEAAPIPAAAINVDLPRDLLEAGDRSLLLAEVERAEAIAADEFRQATAVPLPYAVGGVIHSQFLAVARVQQRLQSLADAARGRRD